MMNRIIHITFLLACYGLSSAQQFELLYDYNNFGQQGNTIKVSDQGYFTVHSAFDVSANQFNTVIARFNENGSLDWNIDLSNSDEVFSQSQSGFAILSTSTDDCHFIIGNYQNSIEEDASPFLLKINELGEHLDTIILHNLNYLNLRIQGGVFTEYGIYLVGRSNIDHPNNEVTLIHCNSEGAYQWHVGYAQGIVANILFIADCGTGIVVGGRYFQNAADYDNNYGKQFISRFRYNDGLRLWTSVYQVPEYESRGAVNAEVLPNGNYLFAGSKRSATGRQPMVGEINRINGDTLWTRVYLPTDSVYEPYNFKRLTSGEYILVGETRADVIPSFPGWGINDNLAFIMKLDSEYNLLWKRIYYPENYAQAAISPAYCYLNDFVENDDGGITALGMVFTYTGIGPQSGFVQDSYLIRVDSEGCLVSGCAVDITEHENEQHLFVYPNPANEQLNVQFPHIDKWQVSIYNMQGALVKEEQYNQLLQYNMNVQELNEGVYILVCSDGENLFTQQFIKH